MVLDNSIAHALRWFLAPQHGMVSQTQPIGLCRSLGILRFNQWFTRRRRAIGQDLEIDWSVWIGDRFGWAMARPIARNEDIEVFIGDSYHPWSSRSGSIELHPQVPLARYIQVRNAALNNRIAAGSVILIGPRIRMRFRFNPLSPGERTTVFSPDDIEPEILGDCPWIERIEIEMEGVGESAIHRLHGGPEWGKI